MDMDGTTEDFVGSTTSNNHDASATHIVKAKGKRTKRQRPLSPPNCALAAAMMTSSSSTASGDDHHVSDGGDYGSFSSTTTTYESTEEEEDMANCLILLAQGGDPHNPKRPDQDQAGNHTQRGSSSSRRFAEMAPTAATSKIGFYIYECKTCNRTFPSFQALGGHRASHKKPKPTTVEENKLPPPPPSPQVTSYELEDAGKTDIKSSPPMSLQFNKAIHSNKAKIHECSICGSEFTSGQALGGHMRRHRASTNNSTQAVAAAAAAEEVKPRNVLQLDLNLPAPEDVDLRDSKFQFKATQKTLVLSAAPLVGCHY